MCCQLYVRAAVQFKHAMCVLLHCKKIGLYREGTLARIDILSATILYLFSLKWARCVAQSKCHFSNSKQHLIQSNNCFVMIFMVDLNLPKPRFASKMGSLSASPNTSMHSSIIRKGGNSAQWPRVISDSWSKNVEICPSLELALLRRFVPSPLVEKLLDLTSFRSFSLNLTHPWNCSVRCTVGGSRFCLILIWCSAFQRFCNLDKCPKLIEILVVLLMSLSHSVSGLASTSSYSLRSYVFPSVSSCCTLIRLLIYVC